MQVLFESRDAQGLRMREFAMRRVRFVMRRLTWMVPHAKVHLADVNGPRGGVDKRCRIELKTSSGGTVQVTALARDWRCVLDTALARASRVLVRTLRRSDDPVKPHHRLAVAFDRFTRSGMAGPSRLDPRSGSEFARQTN